MPVMARGTDLLYKSADPVGAEAVFREVLQRTPTHYGAHYQLAVALDKGGRPAEARAVWDAVLKSAEAISDTTSVRIARTRLAGPDTASQDAMMVLGMATTYKDEPTIQVARQHLGAAAR